MKPKADNENESGMLEFLEDIIGSTRLKEPLNQLSHKVEEMNEIRSEKMNRVKVVEKELKSLEEAKNEALKFLETENKITIEKSKLYQTFMNDAQSDRDGAQKDYDRAHDILQKAMEEINNFQKERQDAEEEQKNLTKEYAVINKTAEDLNEKYKECERRDVQLRDKLKNTKAKGKKLETNLENENKKLEDLLKMPEKCKEDIELLSSKKEQFESDMKVAEEHLAVVMGEIKGDTEVLQKRKDEIEKQLLQLQKGVNEARSQKEIAKSELDLYLSKEQNEKSKLQQLNFKLEKTINDAKDKRTALQRFQTEIPSAEKKFNEYTNELEKLEREKNKLIEEHRLNNNRLMEMRNSAVDTTSRNRVIKELMEQKRKGTLSGIFGRLGDLGAIDRKYDIAISTACGPLDNIVTDTIDHAQDCVEFLKKNNIGSTTFIALDKLKVQWREGETYPEGVPRLFDLIRINDERVRKAFYFALRDTLVANDLDQASRIAYGKKRYRVVTLNGELIEIQGTMSGGGRPLSGRMGSSVAVTEIDEKEIQALEDVVNRMKGRISEINNRIDDIRVESERLSKDINVMKQNKPQFEMEVKRFDELQSALKNSIKEQEEKVRNAAPNPQRVKELEDKFNAENKKFEKEAQKSSKFDEELEELNEKIKDIMDKKVGSARRKAEHLKEQLNKFNSDLSKANVALKTAQRNIEKCEEKIKTIETEKTEALNSLTSVKEELRNLEVEATQVSNDYEKAVNERDEFEQKIKTIQSKISKIKAQEMKLNNENLDAKHEVEQQLAKLNEKDAELKRLTNLIKELELHVIDGKPNAVIPQLSKEEIENLSPNLLQKEIENLEKELKKMKPNMAAIEEFKKKETVFLERAQELEEITKQRDCFKNQYEEIREQRLREFKDGFITIARKLKEMYRMITMGGDAELEYIDSLDPFSEGVTFAVRPNKKSWKKISNLSGGEKTLSSLALIFALHYYKPSPLYVMDEIDAALDFKNVSIVANYIKQRTRNTQFIIISLRNNMYELADRLVGIYKTFNCTKSVTINPTKVEDKRVDRRTVALSSSNTAPNDSSQPKKDDRIPDDSINNSVFVEQ
jgi:structural maintenance of chromosome 4